MTREQKIAAWTEAFDEGEVQPAAMAEAIVDLLADIHSIADSLFKIANRTIERPHRGTVMSQSRERRAEQHGKAKCEES